MDDLVWSLSIPRVLSAHGKILAGLTHPGVEVLFPVVDCCGTIDLKGSDNRRKGSQNHDGVV